MIKEDELNSKDGNTLGVIVKITAILIPLFTGILFATGYGFLGAYETKFNIPHSHLFESTFDLINIGLTAFILIFTDSINFISKREILIEIYQKNYLFIIILCLTFTLTFLFGGKIKNCIKSNNINTSRLISLSKNNRFIIFGNVAIAGMPFLITILMYLFFYICSLFFLIPVIGYSYGIKHIESEITTPFVCKLTDVKTPKSNIEIKSKDVTIKKNYSSAIIYDKNTYCGKIILSTPSKILLYQSNGNIRIFPSKDSIISMQAL